MRIVITIATLSISEKPRVFPLVDDHGTSAVSSSAGDLSPSIASRTATSLAVRSSVAARGPGGRSSVSGMVATVFGATGFLGRYVVQQLARSGSQVMVPYRCLEDDHRHLKLCGDLGQVVPVPFDVRSDESVAAAIAKSNVVINLIGRDFETRNFSFEDINISAPQRIARVAREHGGIARMVHLSCLGAAPHAPSKQHQTKALGEAAVLAEFPQATILRTGPLAGTEDRLLNSWALMAKKFPFVPVIAGGKTLIQPVYVLDVATAVNATVTDDGSSCGQTFELGGPEVLQIRDLVNRVLETIRQHSSILSVPLPVARALATPREFLLHRVPTPIPSPTMFTLDYINSLSFPHIVSPNALTFKDLGIIPHPLTGLTIDYLFAYRSGGPQYGQTVGEKTSLNHPPPPPQFSPASLPPAGKKTRHRPGIGAWVPEGGRQSRGCGAGGGVVCPQLVICLSPAFLSPIPSPPHPHPSSSPNQGIGLALVREFLRAGDRVVVCSRSGERVDDVVAQLQKEFGKDNVVGIACDVSKGDDVKALADFAVKSLGSVDVWINNAGSNAYEYAPLVEAGDAAIEEIVRTNVLGVMLCCRQAMRLMRDQPGGGHIFNMDGAGADGNATPRFAAYGATKRSLAQFTKSLQAELKMLKLPNVVVHNLSPGMVTTDLLMSGANTPQAKFFINALAEPAEEVAQFLVPRVREVPASRSNTSTYIKFLTKPKAFSQIFQRALFGQRKNRYVKED
ncbi:unnamed protein product [Closterium sp. Naga37s-1]|nr:unnamed protein product [Closterium sp. Naga37s-1]CAI5525314.1 unnamed protein product [Closterium sp. Naga37s-1]